LAAFLGVLLFCVETDMSMICWVLGIARPQIVALRAMPSLASDLALAHAAQPMVRFDEALKRMSPEQRKRFEESLAAAAANPAVKEGQAMIGRAQARVAAIGPFEQALSLEKSWHILHYLFTGHVTPANAPGDLLLTGQDVGEDLGYGPPRLHGPEATREFSDFLQAQDLARLQARVNLEEMTRAGVYAMPMGRGSTAEYEGELRSEVGLFFPRLRDYVHTMAGKGNGLLMWLS
jgi:hypothetical protein